MRKKHKKSALYKKLNKQAHRKRRIMGWMVASLSLLGLGASIGYVGYVWAKAPKLSTVFHSSHPIQPLNDNISYLDDSGKPFYRTTDNDYQSLSVKQYQQAHNVINALLATEDRDYFKEGPINLKHTLYAGWSYVYHRGSASVGGGSTLTQQLIKLTFFSTQQKDRTIDRKLEEIKLATELDHKYSKNDILRWYLDAASFGNGQQGLVAAAKYYYDKTPDQLSVLEAATLVGMVNAPATYNPYLNPQATTNRRNWVLQSLVETGKLSQRVANELKKKDITTGLKLEKKNVQNLVHQRNDKLKYNGFVSGVNAQLNRYNPYLLANTTTVSTTMNRQIQDNISNIVSNYKFPDDKLQEAIVVLDNKTGNVVGLSGGRDLNVLGGYNRAFNARRSSGSTIKPLIDYGPAMDLFHWGTGHQVTDESYKYPGTDTEVKDWDNKHEGTISMRKALVESRNVPAVKTLVQVGLDNAKLALSSLGFNNQELYYANAIGIDTNPLTLASAYSAFANGGVRSNAKLVTGIKNTRSNLIFQTKSEQVYSPQTAYMMTDVLQGVFQGSGTASAAKIEGIVQAGKTGTVGRDTSNKQDALTDSWMVGYTKKYTVVTWVGYDNPYDANYILDNKKAQIAIDLYKQVMTNITKDDKAENGAFSMPSGVERHGSELDFAADVDTSDDFRVDKNRQYSYLPATLNMPLSQYSNDKYLKTSLTDTYKLVGESNN